MSPCVVVLEDLDNVGAISRDIAQHPILGELLVAMDGTDGNSGVLAVATTNNLNLLDGAIRARPGRFDRVIAVEAPASDVRRAADATDGHLGGRPEGLDLRWLVRETEGLTGAYLNEVVKSAFIRARQRGQTSIDVVDMEAAVSDVGVRARWPPKGVATLPPTVRRRRNCSHEASKVANRPVSGHLMRKPL